MSEGKVLLETRKLKKYFNLKRHVSLKAVEDVTFKIYEGEKFGVVGESGCGKSTLGRVILQLYKQTSGSCVYHGKSIQELNPKYIEEEIKKLPKYQKDASDFYQKSLKIDDEIEKLYAQRSSFDADGSSKDAKHYDTLSKTIAKKEFESKELKKNASRSLREGSRTVGSLILCKDIDKVQSLFKRAEDEVHKAHEVVVKYNEVNSAYSKNEVVLKELKENQPLIDSLEKKESLTEEESFYLNSLKEAVKKNKKVNPEQLIKENESLFVQMRSLDEQIKKHHEVEMGYREEAFTKYHKKDILPITERTQDSAYQDKLDGNYETGINLDKLTNEEMRVIRRDMQMIFQDPAASLDPRQSIGKAIEEVYVINTKLPSKVRKEKTMELLEKVGLKREHYYSYPHALSGGQKQRVGIARAIALDPSFVVLDEAVSALDVSVQAQILQLLNELSEEKHLTYFFITHDLGVVKHFCDKILVMYLGNVCELSPSKELFHHRLHPYTESLLDSVPRLAIGEERKEAKVLEGEVPSAINPPKGCPFHTRCPKCMDICKKEKPKYVEALPNHYVACHLYDDKVVKETTSDEL